MDDEVRRDAGSLMLMMVREPVASKWDARFGGSKPRAMASLQPIQQPSTHEHY